MERRVPPRCRYESTNQHPVDPVVTLGIDIGPRDEVLGAAGQYLYVPPLPCHQALGQLAGGCLGPPDDVRAVAGHDKGDSHQKWRWAADTFTRRRRIRGLTRSPPAPGARRRRPPVLTPPGPG